MGFGFQKNIQYSRHNVYQIVTDTEDKPNFDMGQTGYERIDDNLIFINIKLQINNDKININQKLINLIFLLLYYSKTFRYLHALSKKVRFQNNISTVYKP